MAGTVRVREKVSCIEGIILSAGFSGRMKQFKPLASIGGVPFLLGIILKLSRVCRKIRVVTGYRTDEIQQALEQWFSQPPEKSWLDAAGIPENFWSDIRQKVTLIFNPDYRKGMFTSLQTGLRQVRDCDWALYHFVDQPQIPPEFYLSFAGRLNSSANWIQPRYRGRGGHPLLLHRSVFGEILRAGTDSTLHTLSQLPVFRKVFWDCPFAEVLHNFNTPTDVVNRGEMK